MSALGLLPDLEEASFRGRRVSALGLLPDLEEASFLGRVVSALGLLPDLAEASFRGRVVSALGHVRGMNISGPPYNLNRSAPMQFIPALSVWRTLDFPRPQGPPHAR